MKKTYQTPEAEKIELELETPVTAGLSTVSNIFTVADESDLPETTNL